VKLPWGLVVGGVDSRGQAGVAADQEAMEQHGLGIRWLASAWTHQGDRAERLSALEPNVWKQQALEYLSRGPCVLKLGLLPGASHVLAAAELSSAAMQLSIPVVLDPVVRASSGFVFLDDEGLEAMRESLLPLGPLLTPNLLEAACLAGSTAGQDELDPDARVAVAGELLRLGAAAVFLKGGHGSEDPVQDLVMTRSAGVQWHRHRRRAGRSIAGSGCRYASALAAGLGLGLGNLEAAEQAGAYVAAKLGVL